MIIELWQTIEQQWKIDLIGGNRKIMFRSTENYANRRNAMAAAKLLKAKVGKAKIVVLE